VSRSKGWKCLKHQYNGPNQKKTEINKENVEATDNIPEVIFITIIEFCINEITKGYTKVESI
jgi:hypothetical protein